MLVEKAIIDVIKNKEDVFILCTDEKNRNVLRTTAFRLRNKMERNTVYQSDARNIGITNENIQGKKYLKVYVTTETPIYKMNEDGELVEVFDTDTKDQDELRVISVMLKDKIKYSEIISLMTAEPYNWKASDVLDKIGQCKPEPEEARIPQEEGYTRPSTADMLTEKED